MRARQLLHKLPALPGAVLLIVMATACAGVSAQQEKEGVLPPVTVKAAPEDSVEKSYRKMIRGMDLFDRLHGLAPAAPLRYKLLPRRRETDMDHIVLEVVGKTVEIPVPVAPDHTFTLERSQKAFDEDAVVTPNRGRQSMTWRTEIRTPGMPPNARRLGDLRLECEVGIEAGLISNSRSLIGRALRRLTDSGYCSRSDNRYLFFADHPLFSVRLAAGQRIEILPINRLYAGASEDPELKDDLPYCDCEVLVDRTYFLPLGDRSWPDDTLVTFEYMDDD